MCDYCYFSLSIKGLFTCYMILVDVASASTSRYVNFPQSPSWIIHGIKKLSGNPDSTTQDFWTIWDFGDSKRYFATLL